MRLRKFAALSMSLLCVTGLMAGCGSSDGSSKSGDSSDNGAKPITVVSREDGSGTRGAFIELFGVEEKDADGNKIDNTTVDAAIAKSTQVMMTTVADDEYAIGYTSLGALNSAVKTLDVDGAEATAENIKSGDYKISRPFNIAVKSEISDITQDFINYIMSADGQQVIEDNGYIAVDSEAAAFEGSGAEGKIVVAGSSSVTPVMEKLSEAYQEINDKAEIEIQESDSTTGMTSAIEGTCDIGMASRELKDTETAEGITGQAIALDGIAIIVNRDNSLTNISTENVKAIFVGDITDWNDIK